MTSLRDPTSEKPRRQMVYIAEVIEMTELVAEMPSTLEQEKKKLIELIKKKYGNRRKKIKHIVFTWDPELEFMETRFFDEKFKEIEDMFPTLQP